MKRTWLFASVIAVLASAPAAAQDTGPAEFTITVPVVATGLPRGVNTVVASCQVLTPENSPVVGAAMTSVTMTSADLKARSFRGDVVVAVRALPSVDPNTATRYGCLVWFQETSASGNIYYFQQKPPNGTYLRNFPLVPGAPFKLSTGPGVDYGANVPYVPLPPREPAHP